MYGKVDKIKLRKTLCPSRRRILSQNKEYSLEKKSPWYRGRYHSINSAFTYLILIGTYVHE